MAMNPGRGGWDGSLVFVVQKTTRCGQTENTGVWDIFNMKEQKWFEMPSRLPRRVSIDSDKPLMQGNHLPVTYPRSAPSWHHLSKSWRVASMFLLCNLAASALESRSPSPAVPPRQLLSCTCPNGNDGIGLAWTLLLLTRCRVFQQQQPAQPSKPRQTRNSKYSTQTFHSDLASQSPE